MRGLAIAPRVAYVGGEYRLLSELARLELDAGDLAEATRRARSSLALVRSGVGEVDGEVRALHVLAEVALAEDDRVTSNTQRRRGGGDRGAGERFPSPFNPHLVLSPSLIAECEIRHENKKCNYTKLKKRIVAEVLLDNSAIFSKSDFVYRL